MFEKLKITESLENDHWDKFILNTVNKNIYSLSEFLNNKKKIKKYFILNNEEIIASFALNFEDGHVFLGENIYSTINFKKFSAINKSSIVYKKFSIISAYLDFVCNNFNAADLIFDFHVNDLRPFFWKNFDLKKDLFVVKKVLYTSIINIENDLTKKNLLNTSFFKNLSRSTKQQYKKSSENNFKFKEEFNLSFAKEVVEKTFQRQNKEIDFDISKVFNIYDKLYKKKLIKMFVVEDDMNIKKSFTIFSLIADHAIYLNGGRLGIENNDFSLTYNLVNSIISLKELSIISIDLEGLNSPRRSFWKSGFGGKIVPYYAVAMVKS